MEVLTIYPESRGGGKQSRTQEVGIDAPELYQYHVNTNTESEQFDVEIQTDQFAGDDEEDEQIDEEYLADWLDFIFPKLSQALDNNIRNDHFANYEV